MGHSPRPDSPERPNTPAGIEVHLAPGLVTVRDARVFGRGSDDLVALFLRRVLTIAAVRQVAIDRKVATGTIRHEDAAGEDVLAPIIAALRGAVAPLESDEVPLPSGGDGLDGPWSVHRHGSVLTSFEVISDGPGRLRLRHPRIRRERAEATRVEATLAGLPGVIEARYRRWSDSLTVTYDPTDMDVPTLLRQADAVLAPSRPAATVADPRPVGFAMPNTALGVAVAGDLLLPVLTPVSAVLLVVTNIKTFKEAAQQIGRRQLGLPVLYSSIALGALASGQFVACALMGWMFRYWRNRSQVELHRERLRLAGDVEPELPTACLVTADGTEVQVATARLQPGDRIVVAAGAVVPADGRVTSGGGLVDERTLAWGGGVLVRQAGDPVQAGSCVLTGLLHVTVERVGQATRVAAVGRAIEAATRPEPGPAAQPSAETIAAKSIGPTLATAGLTFLLGDLNAARAILAPDYATGPGMARPIETLYDVALGLSRGVLLRDPSALSRLATCDLIAIDDHPALHRHGLELAAFQTPLPDSDTVLRHAASAARHLGDDRGAALAAACRVRGIPLLRLDAEPSGEGIVVRHGGHHVRLYLLPPNGDPAPPLGLEINGAFAGVFRFRRARRPAAAEAVVRLRQKTQAPLLFLSDRPTREAARLACVLGIETCLGGLSRNDKSRLLRDCRDRGLRSAWIGAAGDAAALAPACHVAIAHADDAQPDTSAASVVILAPGLGPLPDLWEIAHGHTSRLKSAERLVVVPNLLCVAGALALGFTSLTAVCLSNLGTYGVFARSTGSLHRIHRPRHRSLSAAGGPRVARSS